MKFCVLASGSKGNCTYIEIKNHKFLIDVGTNFLYISKKLVYLCGSDKFNTNGMFVSMTLDEIDYFISDGKIPEDLKEKYKDTKFICTN